MTKKRKISSSANPKEVEPNHIAKVESTVHIELNEMYCEEFENALTKIETCHIDNFVLTITNVRKDRRLRHDMIWRLEWLTEVINESSFEFKRNISISLEIFRCSMESAIAPSGLLVKLMRSIEFNSEKNAHFNLELKVCDNNVDYSTMLIELAYSCWYQLSYRSKWQVNCSTYNHSNPLVLLLLKIINWRTTDAPKIYNHLYNENNMPHPMIDIIFTYFLPESITGVKDDKNLISVICSSIGDESIRNKAIESAEKINTVDF